MKKLGKTGWYMDIDVYGVVLVEGTSRDHDLNVGLGDRDEAREVLREALEALDAPPDLADAADAVRAALDGARVSKGVREAVEQLLSAVDRELES